MKLLVVADLHYSLPQFDWLLGEAARYDLVIVAGDLLDVGSIVDFRAQTLVVHKYLEKLAGVTRTFICSGNHDLDSRTEGGEKVARWMERIRGLEIACDGDGIIIGDNLFTICPWWDGPSVREKLELQLAADARRRAGLRWIWIHHAPPANAATSWSGRQSFGDKDLVQWIESYKPEIVFSGHVHPPSFKTDRGLISSAEPGASMPDINSDRRRPTLHSTQRRKKRFGFLRWASSRSTCAHHWSGRYRHLRDFRSGWTNETQAVLALTLAPKGSGSA